MNDRRTENETRREMLAAIRQHLAASAPFDAVRDEHHAAHKTNALPVNAVLDEQLVSLSERFRAALEAVAGHCVIVPDETEAGRVVRQLIEQINAARLAVSDSPLVERVLKYARPDVEVLAKASKAELFDCDAGITSAQWAVAETGTLILESGAERHRLASLVPPVHIALVEAAQVRGTLAEVLQSLNEQGRDGLSRTVTFITGPSRTSDIELTLAIGVHGPGELFVIIVGDKEAHV